MSASDLMCDTKLGKQKLGQHILHYVSNNGHSNRDY